MVDLSTVLPYDYVRRPWEAVNNALIKKRLTNQNSTNFIEEDILKSSPKAFSFSAGDRIKLKAVSGNYTHFITIKVNRKANNTEIQSTEKLIISINF